MATTRIAVLGGAGFVGRVFLRRLEAKGIAVDALVRGASGLAIDSEFHRCVGMSEVAGQFDVIVNLAYPTSGAQFQQRDENRALIERVNSLLSPGGYLVQTSTLAAFGPALERDVKLGPVPTVRDTAYIEAKIEAENRFAKAHDAGTSAVDIVRLGNVWGPASGAWALPLVQRLIDGRPLVVSDSECFGNITEVDNVADYLVRLVEGGHPGAGVRYHHLAELSSVRWPEWIEPIAKRLEIEPVSVELEQIRGPETLASEVKDVLAPLQPRRVYAGLVRERLASSWARAAVRSIPESLQPRLRQSLIFAKPTPMSREEQMFMKIMAGRKEFVTQLPISWTPPVDYTASVSRVLEWLEDV